MMNYHVLTLFPQMILDGLHTSIIGRAIEAGYVSLEAVNIREFAYNKHQKVDDYPYGGGAGMVMQAEPVALAYEKVADEIYRRQQEEGKEKVKPRVIYLTPQGTTFRQDMAQEFAQEEDLIFLCGHYEGIDERVLEEIVTDYVSIGDYVLTGGELPAMVLIDSISRMVPGVLNNEESAQTESFSDDLLEHPQYSRPEVWRGKKVPQVLLDGDHKKIQQWRREQSVLRTAQRRPDMMKKARLSQKELQWLANQEKLQKKIKEFESLWEQKVLEETEKKELQNLRQEILRLLPRGKKTDWNFVFFCFDSYKSSHESLGLYYLEENCDYFNSNAMAQLKKVLSKDLTQGQGDAFARIIAGIYRRYPEIHVVLERWKKDKNPMVVYAAENAERILQEES